jgi:2-keto-myo-inositol isomerase
VNRPSSTASFSAKLSLSPVTIAQCSFEQAFEQTARAGFTGIGLRYDRFERYLQEGGSVAQVRRWLRHFGLRINEAAFLAEWQFHGGLPLVSRRQRNGGVAERAVPLLKRLHTFLAHCEQFECANVTAVPALRESGDLDIAAQEFAKLCDLARPYGVRLCLEFMGTAPQIGNLRNAEQLIARAGRSNGGLLIDTFLFHQGGSQPADIAGVPIEHVFNVQLADAKPKPREELNMLEDRVFPGEGVAPVQQIVDALIERGYNGWWTVELFNPDYAAAPAESIAASAFAATSRLFSRQASQATA